MELFSPRKKKYASSNVDQNQAAKIFKQMDDYLKENESYLDPDLKLSKLSDALNIPGKSISQSINQVKQINYAQYISNYRIIAAQKFLKSPKYEHYKIAAIAYECGFNSISSFNASFKKQTGMTAKEYRSNHTN